MARTSTNRVTAQWSSNVCISWSGRPEPITERQFEIEFLEPGADVFAFTFG